MNQYNSLSPKGISFTILVSFLFLTGVGYAQETVVLNEFMALNDNFLSDEDGEFSDWVEIYNDSDEAIELGNWALTDQEDELDKWTFPDLLLGPKQYLIIFASGKNKTDVSGELHTNFKLDGAGEYLALLNDESEIITAFSPAFPQQQNNHSFALIGDDYIISELPTPGATNLALANEFLPVPTFSDQMIYHESPFELVINSSLSDVTIYYTIDGVIPDPATSQVYVGPMTIDTTMVIRAIAVKEDQIISKPATQTYLFLEDVINQPDEPEGYPLQWGQYTAIPGYAPADYGMDPEITQDPMYMNMMEAALKRLPVMSIVTDKNNLFSSDPDPEKGGIYYYTGAPGEGEVPQTGKGWERPASVEFYQADGIRAFQIDCGIRLHGGHSRRPEKSPKHSFRLLFKSEYGQGRLDYPLFGDRNDNSLNSLVLRAGFGNSWTHWRHSERVRMQFLRDVWAKDTQLDMGHIAGHGLFVHLYINGLYWGIYNPTERLDDDFASFYLGGDKEDYDVIKDYGEVANGFVIAWNEMLDLGVAGLREDVNYFHVQGKTVLGNNDPNKVSYVDEVNLIDYMILNFYSGNWDWDHHNWVAMRNRLNPGKGFKYFSWDAEHILENLEEYNLNENNPGGPSGMFRHLWENKRFKDLFAARVQKHCFNGGMLTPKSASDRWKNRSNEIELAIAAEAARWGDYRRDVHSWDTNDTYSLYSPVDWQAEKNYVLINYFPNRIGRFINQLIQNGMFSDLPAPILRINGAEINSNIISIGDVLTMQGSGEGVAYTTDGSDPMDENNQPKIYEGSISLAGGLHLKARSFSGQSWSAMTEVLFFDPSTLNNLKITEVHYHPLDHTENDGQQFEFIELKNTGTTPLDLSDLYFESGINYKFPAETYLAPNRFIVLAANEIQFLDRYGLAAFNGYGGALNNGGEIITLVHPLFGEVFSFTYDDVGPWPEEADGSGVSLVPTDNNPAGDQNDPSVWRGSLFIHGSPGRDDVLINGLEKENNTLQFYNYPNPFLRQTILKYNIVSSSQVSLKIYDLIGRELNTLVDKIHQPGEYAIDVVMPDDFQDGVLIAILKIGNQQPSIIKMLFKP